MPPPGVDTSVDTARTSARATVPRATVSVLHLGTGVTLRASTDASGRWMVANVPSGRIRITAGYSGFQTAVREINHDASRGSRFSLALQVGSITNTVEVANDKDMRKQSQQVERNAGRMRQPWRRPRPAT